MVDQAAVEEVQGWEEFVWVEHVESEEDVSDVGVGVTREGLEWIERPWICCWMCRNGLEQAGQEQALRVGVHVVGHIWLYHFHISVGLGYVIKRGYRHHDSSRPVY